MHILLFGGTSEGRELAEWLAGEGVSVTLCVATGYGASLIPSDPRIRVHTGRLDRSGMEGLMREGRFERVVDATHPYAVEVTRNLRTAAENAGLPYQRLLRDGAVKGDWICVSDLAGAAERLTAVEGGILLTTGSKELAPFAVPGLRDRCFPRVLPSLDSLGRCLELGFSPAHVLCMQGPFSKELNLAIIRQYGIGALVTKASGGAGGFWDKVEAAREAGCALVVVERPCQETGRSLEELKTDFKEALR